MAERYWVPTTCNLDIGSPFRYDFTAEAALYPEEYMKCI